MDVFPKFIIEGNALIVGKCTYHKQLLHGKEDTSTVKGGGWWRIDKDDSKHLILHGDSHDFGRASIEDIKHCFEKGVITHRYGKNNSLFIKRFNKVSYDLHGLEMIEIYKKQEDEN